MHPRQIVKNKYSSAEQKFSGPSYECLWPEEADTVNPDVQTYIDHLKGEVSSPRLFRGSHWNSACSIFTSPEARHVVERAFLQKGAFIMRMQEGNTERAESMRPLGFEKLKSLGFGAVFATHRNIANNCPLVLWWGSPDHPKESALGCWYPLLPRRTN